jgi:lipid A 4'-phosphatase
MRFNLIVVLSSILLGLLFHFVPEIDLVVSSWFYNPQEGFFWAESFLFKAIEFALEPLIAAYFVVVAIVIGFKRLLHVRSLHPKHYRVLIYLVLVSVLSAGINRFVVKESFGRARPFQVENFGGDKKFSAAFEIAGQCNGSCSFTSGHTTVSFLYMAFAFIAPSARKRKMRFSIIAPVAVVISCTRVMAGAHFLSDIIFAALPVLFILYNFRFILDYTEHNK